MNKRIRSLVIMASLSAGITVPTVIFDKSIEAQAEITETSSIAEKNVQTQNCKINLPKEDPYKNEGVEIGGKSGKFVGWIIIDTDDPDATIINGEVIDDGNILFEQTKTQIHDENGQLAKDIYKPNSQIEFSKDCIVKIKPVYSIKLHTINDIPIYSTAEVFDNLGFQIFDDSFDTEEHKLEFENLLFSKIPQAVKDEYEQGIGKNYIYNSYMYYLGGFCVSYWGGENVKYILWATTNNEPNQQIYTTAYVRCFYPESVDGYGYNDVMQCYGKPLAWQPQDPNDLTQKFWDTSEGLCGNGKWAYFNENTSRWVELSDELQNNFTLPADSNNNIILSAIFPENVTYNLIKNGTIIDTKIETVKYNEDPNVEAMKNKFNIPEDSYVEWEEENPRLLWKNSKPNMSTNPKTGLEANSKTTLNGEVKSYKVVKFEDEEGNLIKKINLKQNESLNKADIPDAPLKEGYTFSNWDKDLTNITESLEIKPQYKINTYKVTFKDYDGSVLDSQNVDYKNSATKPENPEREGYTFTGWDNDFNSITGDIEINAQYKINTYTVIVDGKKQVVNYGGNVVLPENPTKTGYYFKGWDGKTTNITENGVVNPIFERIVNKVTFIDGENETVVDVNYGDSVEPPVPNIPEGYNFDGWQDASDLEHVTSDKVVKAKYSRKKFSINVNGTIQSVLYGDDVVLPEDPVKEGYTFKGWKGQTVNIKEDGIVDPIFEINKYKVIFKDYNGNVLDSQNVDYKNSAVKPKNPEREGYTFIGWDKDFNSIIGDIEINAQYKINTYIVVVDGKEQIVNYGDDVVLPENPTKTGYYFKGWDGKTTNITENGVVNPIFERIVNKVTFIDGENETTIDVNYGDSIKLPTPNIPEGYDFEGWDISDTEHIISDKVVKAKYSKKKFSINVNGTIQSVLYGDNVVLPEDPIKEGYTFKGWRGQTVNIKEDGIVNPIFEINKYKVIFKDYDGSILDNQNVDYKNSAVKPKDPEREDYIFKGWDKDFDNITEDMEINAVYEKKQYIVQIFVNGTVETKKLEADSDINSILPENPQKEGYTFTGWKTIVDEENNLKKIVADFKINQYIIAFKNINGEIISTEIVNYNDSAILPTAPDIKGYRFIGWSKSVNNVNNNMEVYPIYEKIDDDSLNTNIAENNVVNEVTNYNNVNTLKANSSIKKTSDNKAALPIAGVFLSLFVCIENLLKKIVKR